MDQERWRKIEQLYQAAADRAPAERAAFLDLACAEPGLRQEVEGLLKYADDDGEIVIEGSGEDDPDLTGLPRPPEPAMFRDGDYAGQTIGNYELISLLGKGGMGEVYLARDGALDRKVAIKLLPADVTGDAHRMRRFAQEAKAASALNHPNIVSIYGFHDSEIGQYIVMELIEGVSLRALDSLPLAAEKIAEIGTQVARALEVTHASGLVHRDLKPDNIMLRPDGLVKVLDFGLARLSGPVQDLAETGFTAPGTIVGTVKYMSPEQTRGEWLTQASDIFSLGIVFYELATGKHPFESESAVGYMHSIVSRQPITPSRLVPGIPGWLENLILRMLDKDPAKRCPAEEVLIACMERSARAADVFAARASSRRSVGRKKERQEIAAGFHAAVNGQSLFLCVSGEAGQGKTTLIEDFLEDVTNSDAALVARGRCSERLAGAGAYMPVLEALESLLNGLERELAAGALKNLAPAWYAQLVPGAGAAPAGPSPEKMKRELAALLIEIARQKPLVLSLDDIHWADVATTDILSYLGTRLCASPILILVSYRPSELHSGRHPFLQLQLEMQTKGLSREIALPFFSVDDIRDYIALAFPGDRFPMDFALALHQRTEGNPLFVTDLLRYLRERQAIVERDGHWMLAGPVAEMLTGVPDSVRSMVQRKMEQLSEEERRLLSAASVQGYDFDAAVVAEALAADPAGVEEAIDKLERRSGLVKLVEEYEYPDRTLTLRYRFVHALYQDAFYAALRPARRTSLSRQVAEALLRFHKNEPGKIAAQLAFLFDTARDFGRAAANYQTASQTALGLYASGEAAGLAQRGLNALQSMPDDETRAHQELTFQKLRASALRNLGTHSSAQAAAAIQRVMELAVRLNDYPTQFGGHFGMAWALSGHQEFDRALTSAKECLRLAEQLNQPLMLTAAHLTHGDVLLHRGDLHGSRMHLEKAVSLYDPAHALRYMQMIGTDPCTHAKGLLGVVLTYLGYPDQARASVREAAEVAGRSGNPNALGVSRLLAIIVASLLRDEASLRKATEELLEICVKHEFQASMMYIARLGEAWTAVLGENAAEGLTKSEEAMAGAQASNVSHSLPSIAVAKAEALRRLGRVNEAIQALDEQLARVQEKGQKNQIPHLLRAKAECLMAMSRMEDAERCLRAGIEAARGIDAKLPELESSMALAEVYRATGRAAEGRELLDGALGWFSEGLDIPALRCARGR